MAAPTRRAVLAAFAAGLAGCSPNRRYPRTASVMTSDGKRNPANSERATATRRVDLTAPGCSTARPIVLGSNATVPLEPVAAKYAADWPGWGHRKIYGLLRADGHTGSCSSVQRALRRRGLLQPVDYTGARRELAKACKAAFAQPPTGPNQVRQLDFSEYETTGGGTWRLAGCCDYYSKYEYGWHLAPGCTGADAIAAVQFAIGEAERLGGGISLLEQITDTTTGQVRRSSWSPTTARRSRDKVLQVEDQLLFRHRTVDRHPEAPGHQTATSVPTQQRRSTPAGDCQDILTVVTQCPGRAQR